VSDQKQFTVSRLARELGICKETIRYYHRIGLLPVPPRLPGGTARVYGKNALRTLRLIRHAQQLGFSLEEIRGLIALSKGHHCGQVQSVARKKLDDLERRLVEISNMHDIIATLLDECANNSENAPCPMIEALLDDDAGECGARIRGAAISRGQATR
jgi:DNA-binding transcriptional MerR regulator